MKKKEASTSNQVCGTLCIYLISFTSFRIGLPVCHQQGFVQLKFSFTFIQF